ncbi:chalcone isomerase [Candidatus Magnetomorum sp. HK-1]|nr:chalcone isomerase [Candidatus Magnetomorum sp. HK-1]
MKKFIITVLFFLLTITISYSAQVGDVNIPDTLMAGKNKLILNGAGFRTKFFMKIYAGALYLLQKNADQNHIISADKPMAIKMHIVSSLISSDKMVKAVIEGFEKSTGNNTTPIDKEIKQLLSIFQEKIEIGDVYDLVYIPGKGLLASKNKSLKGTIKGLAFKKALFGIWLCDKPADKYLKKAMLKSE